MIIYNIKISGKMGFIHFTQCGASVINGSNHWVLRYPDQVNKIDPWSGGHKVLFAPTSKKEQMAVVVRYVDERAVLQEQNFLKFVEAKKLTPESLMVYLISTLTKAQMEPACIVSQGYDEARSIYSHL